MVLELLWRWSLGGGCHFDCVRTALRHSDFGSCDFYRFCHWVAAQASIQAL